MTKPSEQKTDTPPTPLKPGLKPPRRKGPIRFEAIVPLCVILGLIYAYFFLFFDLHMRKAIEFVGTKINKARVDVGSLRTRFIKGELTINHIEVTDYDAPMTNKLDVGKIHFQFSWDALLRAKVFIQDASITDIKTGTPRKRSGAIPLPPLEPEKQSEASKLMAAAMDKAKAEFNKTPMAQIPNLISGFDPQKELEAFKNNLSALTKITEIKDSLPGKKADWENRINSLPGSSDFIALKERVDRIQHTNFQDPVEITRTISEVQTLQQEVESKVNSVKQLGGSVVGEVSAVGDTFKSIEDAITSDFDNIKSKLKLPSLDIGDLSASLFGNEFLSKVDQIQYYIHLSRKYFPKKKAKKGAKDDALKPHERGKGVNFRFPRTLAYPAFWLKKALISSTPTDDFGAKMEGSLENVTTNPPMIGLPLSLTLKGDFPGKKIHNVVFELTLDHTQDVATESFLAAVGDFPIGARALSVSDKFKFGIHESQGKSSLSGKFSGSELNIQLDHTFKNVGFAVEAQPQLIQDTLRSVVSDISTIDLAARAKGTWSDIDWSLSSNLAGALQKGLEKLLNQKLAEVQGKIKQFIEDQIRQKRSELESQFAELKGKVLGEVQRRIDEATNVQNIVDSKLAMLSDQKRQLEDRIKQEAQRRIEEEKRRAEQKATEEAKKAAEQMKIKLPF